jgi:long-chain acyl-CoA synthetase
MTMNLALRFAEVARRLPEKPAVFDDGGAHTFGRLLAAAQAAAAAVRGATQREHVAVLAPTSAAFPIAYFGVLLADKVPVPLNFMLDPPTLGLVARDAGFDTVVGSRFFERMVQALGARAVYVEDLAAAAGAATSPEARPGDSAAGEIRRGEPAVACGQVPPPSRADHDAATLLYTSGTMGVPKGVILTHRNLLGNVESCLRHIALSEDNVFLGVLPFFHAFGITTSMLLPLALGCSTVCVSRFTPQRVLEAIARHRVSIMFAVASIYRAILRVGAPAGLDLGSLKLPIAGGEALGADLAERFRELFGVPLLEGFGMTEASPVVSVNVPGRTRPGSVGKLLPWVEARVVDDEDRPLPAGAEGELHLRGECVTPGYHNRPAEAAAAFAPGGWLRTGDLARIDADGYLWITGRKKDLIISGGENFSPNEIESVLHQHPAVAEAAVIGVPDPSRGEVPKAYVVLRDGASAAAADLAAWCRQRLPRFKLPAAYEFRPALPHTPTGKVHKLMLRKAEGVA